jgi:GT2 family glycosyltransferase
VSRLAIIIPYFGDASALEETLVSVLQNRPTDCEILVVLARDYSDPYELKDEVRFVPASPKTGFSGAVNLGVEMTDAPVIHLLTCGVVVAEGWADWAQAHFDNSLVGAVAPMIVASGEVPKVVALGMTYRHGGEIRPIGQGRMAQEIALQPKKVGALHPAAAFFRHSALELAGRFPEHVSQRHVTVDLGLALGRLGFLSVVEPRSRVESAKPAHCAGRFRTAFEDERFFWRWAPVTGWTSSLAMHGVMVAVESLRGLFTLSIVASFLGRTLGGILGILQSSRRCSTQHFRDLAQMPRDDSPAVPATVEMPTNSRPANRPTRRAA